jgi:hypothetical protein
MESYSKLSTDLFKKEMYVKGDKIRERESEREREGESESEFGPTTEDLTRGWRKLRKQVPSTIYTIIEPIKSNGEIGCTYRRLGI